MFYSWINIFTVPQIELKQWLLPESPSSQISSQTSQNHNHNDVAKVRKTPWTHTWPILFFEMKLWRGKDKPILPQYSGFALANWMLTICLGIEFKKKKIECQIAIEVLDLCQKVSIPITVENNSLRQWCHVRLNVLRWLPTWKNIKLS